MSGFLSGFALLFESPGRRAEIALFCMSKGIETSYYWLKRRNLVGAVKYGDALVFGVATGVIGYYYHLEKGMIKASYHEVLTKWIGDI